MGFSARALSFSLLLAAASPALAESPFGSPAWVREQEALRQAEDARLGRKPAAPPAASPAPSEPAIAAAPPEPEAPAETALVEPPPEPELPLPQIAPSANPLSRMAFKDLDGFRQRPLFAPSRRRPDQPVAYAAPPPPPIETPASPPPELRLVGIVAGVDRAVALVSRQEGASLSLRVGDQVDAWRVDRIAPDRVVLREGEREQTYRLFALPPAAAPGARLPEGAVVRVP
ncbi:hypothetical protein ASG52_10395 [Methylobacterium sp. Leaf456]|nr:hypothetical protein ASG52_10395 [Methylobacterium sp. Leaf456]